ncbi:N-acetylneuraminate synthase family protein [Candidatus Pelagibacter sp.]|nr:N-acetylneuraminate synthase family protein [Candidatus Pelagibacter sp.]
MRKISQLKAPYLIAEIGINHNGSLKIAKKLMDIAKDQKFDCVKFQKRDPDICVPQEIKSKIRETPWGSISYLEYKKKIEFSYQDLKILKNYANKIKIDIFTSCFDTNSLRVIKKLNFKFNKIPSAMITNMDFVKKVANQKKLTFISTGMCEMKDIKNAVKIFKKYNCKFILMHCVSLYPCPEEMLNLNMITTLKKKFNCNVGYSGHEPSVSPSIYAYMLGANVIERHITLDRSMWGTDQAASLSPDGMKMFSSIIKKSSKIFGDGVKKFHNKEKEMLKKFKYW